MRIEKTVARYGERFIRAHLSRTKNGTKPLLRGANPVPTYAKRFAAKEACAKALGTGIYRGVFFHDIGVVNLPSGQPTLALSGGALKRLQTLIPKACARISSQHYG